MRVVNLAPPINYKKTCNKSFKQEEYRFFQVCIAPFWVGRSPNLLFSIHLSFENLSSGENRAKAKDLIQNKESKQNLDGQRQWGYHQVRPSSEYTLYYPLYSNNTSNTFSTCLQQPATPLTKKAWSITNHAHAISRRGSFKPRLF